MPGVTVEHRSSHSQITAEDAAPIQAKIIPVSAALADDESPDANVPIRHSVKPAQTKRKRPQCLYFQLRSRFERWTQQSQMAHRARRCGRRRRCCPRLDTSQRLQFIIEWRKHWLAYCQCRPSLNPKSKAYPEYEAFRCELLLFAALTTSLTAQVHSPSAGVIRYGSLPVQGLYGIPGNFVPVKASFGIADAISFSDAGGLIAANGRIELVRADGFPVATYEYGGVAPLLNIDRDLTSAVAWLPDTKSLLWWDGKRFATVKLSKSAFDEKVTSVALTSSTTARLLVTHPDATVSAVVVSLATGNVISSDLLPGVSGPAFQFGSFLLWADEHGLQLQNKKGVQQTLSAPGTSFTAERMSSHWVHLYFSSDRTDWALHLSEKEPSLWRLPAPFPGAVKGSGQ